MSDVSSKLLNNILEGMVVTLGEDNFGDLDRLSKAYQRLKSVGVSGEDVDLLSEVLNNLLSTMLKLPHPECLELLSSVYQRIVLIELNKISNN